MFWQIYGVCPKLQCNNKKLRQTEDGLVCDFCKNECSEVEAVKVAKAVGLLQIAPEEICAVNLWHKELMQILNHVCKRSVDVSNVDKAIDEMNQAMKFPIKLKCAWSSFNSAKNVKKIFALF